MKDAYSPTTTRYILPFIAVFLYSWASPSYSHLPDFATLSEEVSQTVVSIKAVRYPGSKNKSQDSADKNRDPKIPWDELFKKHPQPPNTPPRDYVGSGLIISKDGEVVTNYHVVKGASEIIVKLNNRRELSAKLIGYDEASDIALLKIDSQDTIELSAAKIGSSQALKVGHWVFAIGTPFGFEYTVTAGIVSAKGRSLPADNYVPFIQTDVAINPGNSGGPLFNLQGEAVGINSQIYTRTGSFAGLSFAVPMDLVIDVVRQLKADGKVSRGWLGVFVQEMTRDLAKSFNMEYVKGAIVSKVIADSPAEQAGIMPRDVILKFNGEEIEGSSSLPPIVGQTQVGKQVDVEILRSKKVIILPITLGELPDQKQHIQVKEPELPQQILGLTLRNLSDNERKAPGLDQGGVVVEQLNPGAGSSAGIEAKDTIVMIDNKRFENVSEFESIVKALPFGGFVTVLVVRKGAPRFLALKVR